jgi:hypothetical protein
VTTIAAEDAQQHVRRLCRVPLGAG